MGKLDFLTLNYTNTAPGTGNRLNLTLASGVAYNRGLYLQYIEIYLCRVYDTVTTPFGERNITSCNANVVTSGIPWVTQPQAITLDPNALYSANGYGVSISPSNGPGRVELGDIYIPSTGTFTVTGQIYCPGFINTDRVDLNVRVAFEFENERMQFDEKFNVNTFSF